ncbi:hypothetical protein CHS0354_002025 [Potamilus streckersoni]|uniref:Ammonia monooxygenase n=1 Tax=Potamilus streckersoni TaxID=2493646 RepID=A0AAE0W8E1_9BIVA|nr:hypothetical protein CHS0354_002025 [Potamilus streckersoni]
MQPFGGIPDSRTASLKSCIITVLIGLGGAFLFSFIGLPVPWFTGPLFFTSFAGVFKLKIYSFSFLNTPALIVIGLIIGSSIPPNLAELAQKWWISLAAIFIITACTTFLTAVLQKTLFGSDAVTAVLASLPGALSMVVSLANEHKADVTKVTLFQSLRLIFLLVFLTSALHLYGMSPERKDFQFTGGNPFSLLWLLGIFVFITLLSFKKIIARGSLCMSLAMILSAVCYFTELVNIPPPDMLNRAALFCIGIIFGSRLNRIPIREVFPYILQSALSIILLLAVCAGLTYVFAMLGNFNYLTLFLACFPGAFELATAIAVDFNADPFFVGFHHTARIVFIILLTPYIIKYLPKADGK